MFGIGFTVKDLIRAAWTFLFGVLGFALSVQADIVGGSIDWRAFAVGAIAAGLSAVKYFVLADGTTLKG